MMAEDIDSVELQIELFGLDMQDDIDAWARKLSRQSTLWDVRGMSETDKLDLLERQIEDGTGPFSDIFNAIRSTVAERTHMIGLLVLRFIGIFTGLLVLLASLKMVNLSDGVWNIHFLITLVVLYLQRPS